MPASREVQSLLDRLSAADRAWQIEKARTWWWRACPWLLVAALAGVAADAFFQLGSAARLACDLAGLAALAALVLLRHHIGRVRRNPPERTARHLEQRDPALGSRLINALQLADTARDPALPPLTRDLSSAAVGRYDAELAGIDLPALAPTGEPLRHRRRALFALAGFIVLVIAFFPVTRMVLPRFLAPWSDHPPYAFTRLELAEPGETGAEVVYGGKLPVTVTWSGHEPRELFLTAHPPGRPDAAVTLPMIRHGASFTQDVADIRTDLVLLAHDKRRLARSRERQVRVILTPRFDKAFLKITPPAYTGLKSRETPFAFKSTSALAGSELAFRIVSNRPLHHAAVGILRDTPLAPGAEASPVENPEPEIENSPTLTLAADGNTAAGSLVLDGDMRLRFRLYDIDGIPSDAQPEVIFNVTHDLPPQVRVVAPDRDGYVSIAYRLIAKFEAADDYGVRSLRIHRGLNGVFSSPLATRYDDIRREAAENFPIDFATLGVRPGDRVSFFAEAIDTAPDPHLATSRTVTLTVISEEDYNDILREQTDIRDLADKYQALVNEFKDLRQEQLALAAAMEQLREKAAGMDPAARAAAFDELAARQNALNQRLEQLAARMEKFVRDKPLYDFEHELQEELDRQAAAIRESTRLNRTALDALSSASSESGDAAAASAPDAATFEKMQTEALAQAERLGAGSEKMEQQVRRPLADLARLHDLVKDIGLFERAHAAQAELAELARAYEKRGPLSREDQLALKNIAAKQQAVAEVLDLLPDRLRRHADAASEKFPKASGSARALADAIEQNRLSTLGQTSTSRMLAGDGEGSALLSRRLEEEMAALMGQCNACGGDAADALDQYLRPTFGSGRTARASFEQMRKSRKLTMPGGAFAGLGNAQAQGDGSGGGYSIAADNTLPPVLGNEPAATGDAARESPYSGDGNHPAPPGAGASPALPTGDASIMKNLNPTDRQSDAIPSESTVEEYRELVEEYFRAITTTPEPASAP
ncbi:hypothetical protein OPIT5_25320 [Opitutaceae bacterium TAV5]|nr:hypothetical protein OPIT5_25320 [Opitutaceae bacterium TAV5]